MTRHPIDLRLPLGGLRVLDTTDASGWPAGRLLADFGAEVLLAGTPGPDPTIDAVFLTRNIDKHRVAAAAAELLELATQVDVWLDTGGSGLDVDTARAANPRLVVVTITPFGTSGPYAGRAASDPVLLAMSGILDRAQSGAAGPMLPPARLASQAAGAMAAFLALLSVLRGAAAGEGDHVVLSAHETLIQCSDTMLVRESATRGDTRMAVPRTRYPAFRSSDGGFVRPVLTSPAQWRAVRAWFGEPEELQDPVLDTSLGRAAAAEIIDPHYERLFGALTAEAASEEAQRRGIPVAPIWSPAAVLASEGMRARGTFNDVDMDGVTGLRPSGFLYLEGSKVGPRRLTLAPIEPAADVLELRASDSRFTPLVRALLRWRWLRRRQGRDVSRRTRRSPGGAGPRPGTRSARHQPPSQRFRRQTTGCRRCAGPARPTRPKGA
jgi:crotonobetainyl-CoA:carnitine CoA-transferase CaiB-like acyl-CoA transferase